MTNLETSLHEIKDSDWVNNLFFMSSEEESEIANSRRFFTTANHAIGGSGLGNSRVINPPPGINAFCDIPRGFDMRGGKENGTGLHYHESLDKTMEVLSLRPGVARHNALSSFWFNAFSESEITSGEYGWFHSTVGSIARFVGGVIAGVGSLLISPIRSAYSLIYGDNSSRYRYYYLTPASLLYWTTLDNLVNDVAIRLGITGNIRSSMDGEDGSTGDNPLTEAGLSISLLNMPGVMVEEKFLPGTVRVSTLAIAHRYTMMNNAKTDYLKKKSEEILGKTFTNEKDFLVALGEFEQAYIEQNPVLNVDGLSGEDRLRKVQDAIAELNGLASSHYEGLMGKGDAILDKYNADSGIETTQNADGTFDSERTGSVLPADSSSDPFLDFNDPSFAAIAADAASGGIEWVNFSIDKLTEFSVSIQNEVGPSAIEGMFNGAVSAAKGAWFNVGGGNIGDNAIANTMESLAKTGTAAFNGLLGGLVGGMPSAILGGKAFLTLPDVYQSSRSDFSALSCSLTSRATSGHPQAKLKMLMPYLALLALSAPRSAGPSGYLSPFLVEGHAKGKASIQMGLIGNLNATFASEDGWDFNEIPNDLKITFDIVNLNKGFNVPLDPNAAGTYSDQNEFIEHMSVLTGQSLNDKDRAFVYNTKTRFLRSLGSLDRYFSKEHWGLATGTFVRDNFSTVNQMLGFRMVRN